ncbi:MAG TPA: C40 family peptidase [Mycobacteriales bacterium]|nr:C40 family peptidase [Mycobacteriales bacterium]
MLALVALVPGTVGSAEAPRAFGVLRAASFDIPVTSPVGLDDPGWQAESPSVLRQQLTSLPGMRSLRGSSTLPFHLAAAADVTGPATAQGRLIAALLKAARSTLGGLTSAPAAQEALTYALAQIGRPYLWGATGPEFFDCSGLIQQAYLHAGVDIPRTSREQARIGIPVPLADLLPGDLLFYAYDLGNADTIHHVTMYAGGGMVVHAPEAGDVVHLSPVWLDQYIGAVRPVPAVGAGPGGPTGPGLPLTSRRLPTGHTTLTHGPSGAPSPTPSPGGRHTPAAPPTSPSPSPSPTALVPAVTSLVPKLVCVLLC